MTNPSVCFHIDTAAPGAQLGNKASDINLWTAAAIDETIRPSPLADIRKFVETIQITLATGGNPQCDLFADPLDRSTLTDYDFGKLIRACRGILSLGLKPYLKMGNVPFKLTSGAAADPHYGVNQFPPDDYSAYYRYIRDTAAALAKEFGRDEVASWRYSVLNEYENVEWFFSPDKDSERSMQEYCKLYDTTAAALQDALGDDVCVGAHAMGDLTNHMKLWDPRLLLEHCATGRNYITGGIGAPIHFLTISSYEWPMCQGLVRDLGWLIAPFKTAAEKYGLSLFYGVDESRIGIGLSSGTLQGSRRAHPANHITGHTYQAAYDAQLIKQMVDNDIAYCSAWGYTSAHGVSNKGDAPDCYPTVSFHVANEYHKMCHGSRLPVRTVWTGEPENAECQVKIDALASADDKNIYVMAYNFANSVTYDKVLELSVEIDLPNPNSKQVEVTRCLIGDEANFFPEWLRDREKYGIGDDCFLRSPDSAALDSSNVLKKGWASHLYRHELRRKYVELSKLRPVVTYESVTDGKLILKLALPANNVVFYTVRR